MTFNQIRFLTRAAWAIGCLSSMWVGAAHANEMWWVELVCMLVLFGSGYMLYRANIALIDKDLRQHD